MADKKISALTAATTPLAGTEVLPIVQGSTTVKVAVSDLTTGRAVSATSFTASTGNFIVGTTAKGLTTGGAIPLGLGVNTAVDAITIDTANNVGIGTTFPGVKFQIQQNTGTAGFETGMSLTNAVDSNLFLQVTGSANADKRASIYTSVSTAITFGTNTTERMRIDSSGNVGIGAPAAATAILDVQSTTKGVRFPNMTTVQKNLITPSAGTVVFDTTLAKLCVYSGAAWQTITST